MPAPRGFKRVKKLMKSPRRVCARGAYGLTPERKGVRVLVCCPKGKVARGGKCKVATKAVEIFKRKRK